MSDREFDTDEEQIAYAAGLADAAKKKPLTMAEVRSMSPAEIAARKGDVHAAIRRANESEGDDDEGDE